MDFRIYRILGVGNPAYAYKELTAERHIGAMLHCNVIVQELDKNKIEVSAVDPVAPMMAIKNEALGSVATEVREKLKRVIDNLR